MPETTENLDTAVRADVRSMKTPQEQTALAAINKAYHDLLNAGWKQIMYCPKDGKIREFIEPGSTGVHQGYRDEIGCWLHDGSDLWPSDPILFREIEPAV